MAHTSDVLSQFQDGEVRLIFARTDGGGPLVLLNDGDAQAKRSWAREHARCPVADCPEPALTTVSRSRGRDGFRHLGVGAGGHSPESLFHVQACERIAVWLRETYPRSTVNKEERSNSAGERRADVMVTAPSGERIAFEIQYSPLTPDDWQRRHDSYAAQGIADVWLFGHSGAQLRAFGGHGRVSLNPTHDAVLEEGLPLIWFNPFTLQVGTAIDSVAVSMREIADVAPMNSEGQLRLDALDVLRLDTRLGVTSDRLQQMTSDSRRATAFGEQIRKQEAAAERARAAALTVRAAKEYERAIKAEKILQQRRVRSADAAAALEQRWSMSAPRERILLANAGQWPAWLDVPSTHGPGLPLPHQQWQATLFDAFLDGRAPGFSVNTKTAAELLNCHGLSIEECRGVIREWFDALVGFGFLHARSSVHGYTRKRTVHFTVSRPTKRQRAAGFSSQVDPAWAAAETRDAADAATAVTLAGGITGPCSICHLPLFPGNDSGVHTVCEPSWRAGPGS